MYTIGSGTATDITAALTTPIEVDRSPRTRFFGGRCPAEADELRQSKIASARTSMLSRGSTHW